MGGRYEELALTPGVRSREVTERIALHLRRFGEYLSVTYGHERLASVVRSDVVGWRDALVASGPGPSTVNNHLASLSGFCGFVDRLDGLPCPREPPRRRGPRHLSDATPPSETEALAA